MTSLQREHHGVGDGQRSTAGRRRCSSSVARSSKNGDAAVSHDAVQSGVIPAGKADGTANVTGAIVGNRRARAAWGPCDAFGL